MLTRLSPLAGYGLQSEPRADAANTSGIRNWATFGSRRAIGLCPSGDSRLLRLGAT